MIPFRASLFGSAGVGGGSPTTQFGLAQYDIGTSTGTLDITDTDLGGATPKFGLMVLATHRQSQDPNNSGGFGGSFGFTDGAGDFCTVPFGENDRAKSNAERANANYLYGIAGTGTSFASRGDVSAMITDGVRINRAVAAPLDYTGFMAMLSLVGGSVAIGETNLGTGTSPIDVTSPGFEPDALILVKAGDNAFSSPAFDTANMNWEFGIVCNDGADTQASVSWAKRDNVTTGNCRLGVWTGRALTRVSAFSGAQIFNLVAGSFDASGFSLTPSASASSQEVAWAAIKLASGNAKVITGTTPTSTGNQAYTGVGFQPKFVLIIATSQDAINPASTINESNTLGASVGISAFNELGDAFAASYQFSDDGLTVCSTDVKADIALQVEDNVDRTAGGDPAIRASFVSMDADGFTLNFDQVEASGRYFIALALG